MIWGISKGTDAERTFMYLCVVVEVETAEIGEGHSGRGCFAHTCCGGHIFGRGYRFGWCPVVRWLQALLTARLASCVARRFTGSRSGGGGLPASRRCGKAGAAVVFT